MKRVRALIAGVGVVIVLFGGVTLLRVLSRFLRAAAWFAETVALFAFALLCGYLTYRVLWGDSDDPRVH
jgi:hypothetical protein